MVGGCSPSDTKKRASLITRPLTGGLRHNEKMSFSLLFSLLRFKLVVSQEFTLRAPRLSPNNLRVIAMARGMARCKKIDFVTALGLRSPSDFLTSGISLSSE